MTHVQLADAPSERRFTPRGHVILALIFLGALAIRGLYLWGQARNNPLFDYPMMDARFHHEWAKQIASGEGMGDHPYFRAPLYYYLLGVFYWVFGPSVAWARMVGCLLGAATCYLVARLGVMLAGFRAGVLAGILAAVYWPFVYFDGALLTVGLEVFLDVTLLLLLEHAARRPRWPLLLAGGIVWGLSAITRPNILALAPAILAWAWLVATPEHRLRHAIRTVVLVGAGAAMMILPVTVRNYLVGREWVLVATSGGMNFCIGNNPRSDGTSAVLPGARKGRFGSLKDTRRMAERELGRTLSDREVSDYWYGKAFAWIRSNPSAWARLMLRKLWLFWSPIEIPNNQPIGPYARQAEVSRLFWIGFPVVACLGIAGMVVLREQWRRWFLPIAFLVIYTVTVVAFFCNARYRLPVIPVLILFAAAGVVRVVEQVRSRKFGPVMVYLGVAVVVAAVMAISPPNRERFGVISEAKWHRMLAGYYSSPQPDGPNDWAQTAEHFRKAVELTPWHVESHLGLGRALVRLDRLGEAEKEFAEVVRQHPKHAEARLFYAAALATAGKSDQAIAQYEAALTLRPFYAEAREGLGCLLVQLGRDPEAIPHLRQALAIEPDLPRAPSCLELARRRQGQ